MMRIGMMLRAIDEPFGIGVYTRNIVPALLDIDRKNQYVLFYKDDEQLGRFARYPNVEENLVRAPHKLVWDQLAIPLAARRHQVDVLFHPKFTVPFFTHCKTVMVLHGSGWFLFPEFYGKLDIRYVRVAMPLYCRRADALIANSELTKRDFVEILGVPPEKIQPISHGLLPVFRPIRNKETLQSAKERYRLPDRYVLTVGRYTPRKNVDTAVKAFSQRQNDPDLKLVLVGDFHDKPELEKLIHRLGLDDEVIRLGYVDQSDLPAIYNLAEVLIFPSAFEELGLPLIEAMACGCPIVASNVGAIPEVTGDGALLTDPYDVEGMAQALDRISGDSEFAAALIAKGLARVQRFSYEAAARKTLAVLENLG